MSMGPPPAAVQRVPIRATATAAYRTVFGQLDQLIRAALLPFLLNTVLVAPTLMATGNPLVFVVMVLLTLVPYTLCGVTWHRLALLGKPSAPAPVFPGWQRRHWRFYGYALVIMGLNVVLQFGLEIALGGPPIDESGEVIAEQVMRFLLVMSCGFAVFAYLALRLSFVFPAVAVDENYGLKHAWSHTAGQGFRLMAIMVITLFPVLLVGMTVIVMAVGALAPSGGSAGPGGHALAYMLMSALLYVLVALSLAVISTAFRICTGWVAAAPGTPVALVEDEDGPSDREH